MAFGQRFDRRRLDVEPRELSLAFDGEEREATVQVLVRPLRRGRHALGPLTVRELDPLGLLAGRALAEVPATTVLVGPPVFEWALHDGNSGRRLSPGGIPFATHTSDAMELVGTREVVYDRVYVDARGGAVVDRHPDVFPIKNREVFDAQGRSPPFFSSPGPRLATEGSPSSATTTPARRRTSPS